MRNLPEHLFVTSFGDLHDTRLADWASVPLRAAYQRTFEHIETVAQFKATLRNGASTDLGGYPLHFITDDGAALSFDAARQEFRQIADSIANRHRDGWRVVACTVNYEDEDLHCEHTGKRIPSAYGAADPEPGFNLSAHAGLVALGFQHTRHEADWEDEGDGESGPRLTGGPAWDEYEDADFRVVVDDHGMVALWEPRDLQLEAWIAGQQPEGPSC
jgi:hypothetical protein